MLGGLDQHPSEWPKVSSPAWLRVLEEIYAGKPISLAYEDTHGQLRGVLPLFYKRGLLTSHRLSPLSRTPIAGPLADNEQVAAALLIGAIERVHDESCALLQIKVLSNAFDELIENLVGIPERTMYLLKLPERPEFSASEIPAIMLALKWWSTRRRLDAQVFQAETERELRDWYGLYLDPLHQVVATPSPYQFLQFAWQRLRPLGLLRLLLAKYYEAGRAK